MAAGLQCWDGSGNLVLDVGNALPKVVKVLDSGVVPGAYVPPYPVTGLWASAIGFGVSMPAVSVTGNTVSWTFNGPSAANYKIIVGGY